MLIRLSLKSIYYYGFRFGCWLFTCNPGPHGCAVSEVTLLFTVETAIINYIHIFSVNSLFQYIKSCSKSVLKVRPLILMLCIINYTCSTFNKMYFRTKFRFRSGRDFRAFRVGKCQPRRQNHNPVFNSLDFKLIWSRKRNRAFPDSSPGNFSNRGYRIKMFHWR